jgi:ferritin
MNTIFQRIALYATLGLVLSTLDVTIMVWQFWAVLALFWVSEFMVRKGTEELAQAQGIAKFLNMSSTDQERIKKIHRETFKDTHEG